MSSLRIIQDQSDKISDAERERLQREGDAKLIRALALAFRRGDHLPVKRRPQAHLKPSTAVTVTRREAA